MAEPFALQHVAPREAPLAGRFVLEQQIGEGGMATVHRALDLETGRRVAVKRLHPGSTAEASRFAREAEIMQRLDHPAIVRWVAHGDLPGGVSYLAMEWLEGEDLRMRLQRGRLALHDALFVGARAAEALDALHGQGIVHRDVKPANIVLCDGDPRQAKLIDFGVARWNAGASRLTMRGAILGTPGFMSPEQARGEKNVDGRADLFALGCVLYTALTGARAFPGERAVSVLAKVVLGEFAKVRSVAPDVPEPVESLVHRLLAREPDARPQRAADVAEELRALARSAAEGDADAILAIPGRALRRALTSAEQRFVTVLLASSRSVSIPPPGTVSGSPADASSSRWDRIAPSARAPLESGAIERGPMSERTVERPLDASALRALAEAHGATLSRLADGSWMVHVARPGAATDNALRMARCALALREALPHVPMGLATGRGFFEGDQPAGDAIDRAARMLRAAQRAGGEGPAIFVDASTEALSAGRLDVEEVTGGRAIVRERASGTPRRWLLGRPQPCVGRDREIDALVGALDAAFEARTPKVAMVVGVAGAGKSRLRSEVERALEQRGQVAEVWIGRGDLLRAGAPFGVLRALLYHAFGLRDGDPEGAQRARIEARVAACVAPDQRGRVAAFLGEIAGVPFPEERDAALRAARRDAVLLCDQTRRAFADFVEAECRMRPLLIVLEDLHWGDVPTIEHVGAAIGRREGVPLFVLALARPEVHERFPGLWRSHDVTQLGLLPLGSRACEVIVRNALGPEADPDRVASLCQRSAGNPFFLEELIRAEVDGREGTPETVLAVVDARLAALAPEARRILRAASVLGQVFWSGAIAALASDLPRARLDALFDELVAKEWVARRAATCFAGERELTFRHALLREAAYATLTPEDRALGHALAAEWLERSGAREAAVLAEHWGRGGDRLRAAEWHVRAAHQAIEGNDWARALEHAEAAERWGATGESLGEAALAAAEASFWRGSFVGADGHVARALELLPVGSERWFLAARCAAETSFRVHRHNPLGALYDALRATFAPDRVTAPQLLAAIRMAVHLRGLGDHLRADDLTLRAEEAAARLPPDPTVTAHLLSLRATRRLFEQDFGGFLAFTVAAVDAYEEAGDARRACNARVNAGYAATALGRLDEAERLLRHALAGAERDGLGMVRTAALHNLGGTLGRLGRLEEALAVERQALALGRAQGDERLAGCCHLYLARILVACGDTSAAEEAAREAVASLAHVPPLLPFAEAALADALLAAGRSREALVVAETAMRRLEAMGRMEDGEALVRVVFAECLLATGDESGARRSIEAARARLTARATRLPSAEERDAFFRGVSEHARTLALAGALGI